MRFSRQRRSAWLRRVGWSVLLGAALVKEEQFESAEEQLMLAEDGLGELGPEGEEFLPMNHQRLVHLYEAWGFPDLAAEWKDPAR